MHIENLYRPEAQEILLFKECYALEKIHGTSAHIAWKNGKIRFFSGGVSYDSFAGLFSGETIFSSFVLLGHEAVTVYGEAYGGKCQGMSATYGRDLRFVAFDVKIGDMWLSVPNAADVARKLGIEFVHYELISTDLSSIDAQRDAPSVQAVRNGIAEPRMREGVVLRTLVELTRSNGSRIMAKHKRPEFSERKTIQYVDPAKRAIMENAEEIAAEWVTDMRLNHILDKLGNPSEFKDIPRVIDAMVEDVTREELNINVYYSAHTAIKSEGGYGV